MEPIILHIETATFNGSVALSKGSEIVAHKELAEGEKHIKTLAPSTKMLLNTVGITMQQVSAIAVSKGPGSYTGLRIGVSFAKGLAMASGAKLISVPTLEILRNSIFEKHECNLAIPLLDARRMEVYTSVYSREKELETTQPLIIDESSFKEYALKKVVFAGNGAAKCVDVLSNSNWLFDTDIVLSASAMLPTAMSKYNNGDFEDLVDFEPFYLKEFMVGKASKKIANILNS